MTEKELEVLKKILYWIELFKVQIYSEPEFYEAFKKTYPEIEKALEKERYALIVKNWLKVRKVMMKTIEQLNQYVEAEETRKYLLWMPLKR